jgi:Tol biopolymer transport system component/DNA-binding winged helix-turn-helix (wHTH) protein
MEKPDGRCVYEFGDFRVDAVQRLLLLKADGRPLPLVSRGFETLLYFVQHHGELLDKATLMKAVWPDAIVEENNLNQSITAIRRVLGESPGEHRFIVTVPGRGYRFVAEVSTVAAQPSGVGTAPPAAQPRDALAKVDPEVVLPVPGTDRRSRERLAWIGVLAVLTLALAASLIFARRPSPPAAEMRVEITTPPTTAPTSLAISPDGRTIAFVATFEGRPRVWLRSLESGSARPLPGTDGALSPFWSPDSRSVGFFAEGKLKRVDAAGGSVRTLASASRGRSGAWSRDGTILFAMLGTPIFRVSDTGGEPIAVTQLEGQPGSHFAPQFLPDNRHFLYWVRGSSEVSGVYVGQLGSSQSRRLFDADAGATYVSSGQLLFLRQGTLFAQEFNPLRLELTGKPFSVAEQVASGAQGAGVSVSSTGSIIYRASAAVARRQFVWFDRSGKEIGNVGDSVSASTGLFNPSLSLDGQRVALYQLVNGNADVWLLETRRGVFSRFTSDVADDVMPVWSPGGDRIVFSSNRRGIADLYQKSVTAGGSEELLLSTAQTKIATDWSPDGRFVLFNSEDPKRSSDIWALPLDGNGKPFPAVQTGFEEQNGQFSPDGNWIAYQSDESGRVEIYVQPFPDPGNKWPISTNGGSQVRWRRDGKELFYVALDGRLMSVSIHIASNAQAPEVGTPVTLFAPQLGGAVERADFRHQYMVSADGQRFLVATVMAGANSPIMVILNWKPTDPETRRLLPPPQQ